MNIDILPIKNIELNTGMYATDVKKYDGAVLVHDKEVDDNYWNYLYIEKFNKDIIEEARTFFHKNNLPLSIYFLEGDGSSEIQKYATDNGFNLSYKDAIMVFEGTENKSANNFEIKQVKGKKGESDFLSVYKDVFCDEEAGVYSGLSSGYLNNMKEYFAKYLRERRSDFVAYKDGEPAGIASVVFDDDYAAIMNVAVLSKFRMMGVARELTWESIDNFRNKELFLSTEKDSIDEEIYKKFGFKTVATGKCYTERRN